jgi:hypothetical protein
MWPMYIIWEKNIKTEKKKKFKSERKRKKRKFCSHNACSWMNGNSPCLVVCSNEKFPWTHGKSDEKRGEGWGGKCSRHGFLHQRMNANGSDTK